MSYVQQVKVSYRKQYVLKLDDQLCTILDAGQLSHFEEGEEELFQWQWVKLPMDMKDKCVNKLLVSNPTNEMLMMTVLIRYEVEDKSHQPFIYYSPSKKAIIFFDSDGYKVFGGASEQSDEEKFSTLPIDLTKWSGGGPFPMQPLTKQSGGWGMEYTLILNPGDSNYLYEWEFANEKLHELEELHSRYKELLGRRKETSY